MMARMPPSSAPSGFMMARSDGELRDTRAPTYATGSYTSTASYATASYATANSFATASYGFGEEEEFFRTNKHNLGRKRIVQLPPFSHTPSSARPRSSSTGRSSSSTLRKRQSPRGSSSARGSPEEEPLEGDFNYDECSPVDSKSRNDGEEKPVPTAVAQKIIVQPAKKQVKVLKSRLRRVMYCFCMCNISYLRREAAAEEDGGGSRGSGGEKTGERGEDHEDEKRDPVFSRRRRKVRIPCRIFVWQALVFVCSALAGYMITDHNYDEDRLAIFDQIQLGKAEKGKRSKR